MRRSGLAAPIDGPDPRPSDSLVRLGDRFGRLTVQARAVCTPDITAVVLCCQCGQEVWAPRHRLLMGATRDCGDACHLRRPGRAA